MLGTSGCYVRWVIFFSSSPVVRLTRSSFLLFYCVCSFSYGYLDSAKSLVCRLNSLHPSFSFFVSFFVSFCFVLFCLFLCLGLGLGFCLFCYASFPPPSLIELKRVEKVSQCSL